MIAGPNRAVGFRWADVFRLVDLPDGSRTRKYVTSVRSACGLCLLGKHDYSACALPNFYWRVEGEVSVG